jgi:hypothetical protein
VNHEGEPGIRLKVRDAQLMQALAYRGTRQSHGHLLVTWANAVLEVGDGGPSVALLAICHPEAEADIEDALAPALTELGVERPSPVDAALRYAAAVLETYLAGTVAAPEALAELAAVYEAAEHDVRLVPFVYLADDLARVSCGEEPIFPLELAPEGPDLELRRLALEQRDGLAPRN